MAGLRPRRSMLYTPGTRTDRVEKALTMDDGPDMVVADLEDAVGPDDKERTREAVAELLAGIEGARAEACVRVNGVDTPWHKPDLTRIIRAAPDTIVVPKVEKAQTLEDLSAQLDWLEEAEGLDPQSVEVVAQLETARGIAHATEIAEAIAGLDRVTALVFGAEDYAADVGAWRTESNQEVYVARSQVVMAAAVAGVQALDHLFIDYQDTEALATEARAGRDLGYVGKQIIHPAQIAPVHQAFTPTEDEIVQARELLAAVEEAGIGEGGVIGFKGRMVDRPVIEQARRTAAMADALGL